MPTAGSGANDERQVEAGQRDQHDERVEQRDGDPLAGDELDRPRRRHQQRLERLPLALAGGRVERHRHAAHHRGEQAVERDEEQHDARPTAAVWRDRCPRPASGSPTLARRRAAAAAARPTGGCRRAAATRPGRSTAARGRASGRRRGAPSPACRRRRRVANVGSTTSTTSRSPRADLRFVVRRARATA